MRQIGNNPVCPVECVGRISEVSTRGFDLSCDLTGVGGGPGAGALSRAGLFVPEHGTEDPFGRYLFLLCGVVVPNAACLWVRGLRQAVLLRAEATTAHSVSGDSVEDSLVLEREVESPFWSFPDGNVSWHLRWLPGDSVPWPSRSDPDQSPSTSPGICGVSPALLYLPPLFPYRPPNRGSPPGEPVGDWGTFYDLRFPWQSQDFQLGEWVGGPGRLLFFASVRQTCAGTRPTPEDLPGLRVEDAFVSTFPTSAVYGRVAGSIIFEVASEQEMKRRSA